MLTNIVQQLQEQVQVLQNPLKEAEEIRAQAKLIEAQGKQTLDMAKLAEDQRQFNTETAQKQDQFMKDLAIKLTQLEVDVRVGANRDLNNEFKDNQQTQE